MDPENTETAVNAPSNPLWEQLGPLLPEMGFGGVLGLALGYFAKKSLKIAGIALGLIFIVLQALAHENFITINYETISQAFDQYTGQAVFTSIWDYLTDNLPFGGSFSAGFVMGFLAG